MAIRAGAVVSAFGKLCPERCGEGRVLTDVLASGRSSFSGSSTLPARLGPYSVRTEQEDWQLCQRLCSCAAIRRRIYQEGT